MSLRRPFPLFTIPLFMISMAITVSTYGATLTYPLLINFASALSQVGSLKIELAGDEVNDRS